MNAPTPQSTPLEVAIAAYKTALNSLEIRFFRTYSAKSIG
jgi:hypothetical protein